MNAAAHTVSETAVDGVPVVVLAATAAGLEAAFAPRAGMVGCSFRHRGEELLGQRGGLSAYVERGSSFGIPLLHPWANRLDGRSYRAPGSSDTVELDPERAPLRLDEHDLPIHGLLAGSPHWELVESAADSRAARLVARLDFGARPELLAGFPFPHELRYEASLSGASLSVRLTLRATGVVPVPVSFGFHPYLTLPGVPRAKWQVELPVKRRALLDDRGIPTGRSEAPPLTGGLLGDIALDDLFPELSDPPVFAVQGGGRRIEVAFESGYPVAQVYSPADSDFICFEPMTAPTNALVSGDGLRTVRPGESFEAAFRVSVAED